MAGPKPSQRPVHSQPEPDDDDFIDDKDLRTFLAYNIKTPEDEVETEDVYDEGLRQYLQRTVKPVSPKPSSSSSSSSDSETATASDGIDEDRQITNIQIVGSRFGRFARLDKNNKT